MKIMSADQIRQLEEAAVNDGATMLTFMRMAGAAAAQIMIDRMDVRENDNVAVICGKGRNGGDGFIAAAYLKQRGINSTIILMDGLPRSADAQAALRAASGHTVTVWRYWENKAVANEKIKNAKFIIDAFYGIGFKDGFLDRMVPFIEKLNKEKENIMSLDLPSGVLCDSGKVVNTAVRAKLTVSFTALKPAHVLYPSMDYCGETVVANIGIDRTLFDESPCLYRTVEDGDAARVLPKRTVSDNKGSCGTLLTVCGSSGMAGAAAMSAKAAMRCGVGLTKIAAVDSIYPILSSQIYEGVFLPVRQTSGGTIDRVCIPYLLKQAEKATAVLLGCGLGKSEDINALVYTFISQSAVPLIIDADGINAVSQHIDILKEANVPVVITPHPGEAARLLNTTAADIQNNRVKYAQKLASDYRVITVLKGAKTLIAHPDGRVLVNTGGNAGMAKGGSGDVLAGMIASFAAQGTALFDAAVAGVYLHSAAGDRCVKKYGMLSMLPTDMIEELPAVIQSRS